MDGELNPKDAQLTCKPGINTDQWSVIESESINDFVGKMCVCAHTFYD